MVIPLNIVPCVIIKPINKKRSHMNITNREIYLHAVFLQAVEVECENIISQLEKINSRDYGGFEFSHIDTSGGLVLKRDNQIPYSDGIEFKFLKSDILYSEKAKKVLFNNIELK